MAPSYRNINGEWPAESRRGRELGEEQEREREREQEACSCRPLRWNGDLDVGWRLAGSRSTVVVWPDAAGLVREVWEVRSGLADCSSTVQSTQFLCRGGRLSSSKAGQGRLGPNFRWRREPGALGRRASPFGRDSFKYSGSSTRCHKDEANNMFQASHRIEFITGYRRQAGMFQPRVHQAKGSVLGRLGVSAEAQQAGGGPHKHCTTLSGLPRQ